MYMVCDVESPTDPKTGPKTGQRQKSKPPVNTHVTVLAFTLKKLNSLPTADLKRLAYLQRT